MRVRSFRSPWPWVGLAIALLLTLTVWLQVRRMDQARLGVLQSAHASAVIRRIERRMWNLVEILRGAAGYLGRGPLVTREEWRSYVGNLNLAAAYPGLQGLSFVEWIPREAMAGHLERLRKEGFPEYSVVPGGPLAPLPEGFSSIVFLEPMNERNQRAFGRDMLGEATRRAAMLQARDTGQVVLSGKLILYQETQTGVQAGSVLFAPVYRQGQPTATVADRRRALRGWTTIPLRMADFMRATVPSDTELADIEVYDNPEIGPEGLLFDSDPAFHVHEPGHRRVVTLSVAGRAWTVRIDPSPAFFAQMGRTNHWEVLFGGLVGSLLLFILLAALLGSEDRARRLADQRGEALRSSEERFRSLFDLSPDPITLTRLSDGALLEVNQVWCEMTGLSREENLGQSTLELGLWARPEERDAFRSGLQELGAVGPLGVTLRSRTGQERQLLVTAKVLEVAGEACFLSMGMDVTERSRIESALKESEARFRSVVEESPVAIFLHREGRFTFLNTAALRLFRVTRPADLMGTPVLDRVHPDDQDLVRQRIVQGLDRGRPNPLSEQSLITMDGVCIEAEVQSCPATYLGQTNLLVFAWDITARKHAEEALLRSEARLRILGDQLPDSFLYQFGLDATGAPGFIYVSAGVERLCGVKAEEVMRDPGLLLSQVDPAMLPAYLEAEAVSARDLAPFAMDLRQRRADGAWRWFRVRSAPRLQPDGSRIWEGISTDVTEIKQAEIALRESEARWHFALDGAGDGVWDWDGESDSMFLSRGYLSMLGYGEGEVIGTSYADWVERIHPEDRELVRTKAAAYMEGGLPAYGVEYRIRRKDGSYVWVLARGLAVAWDANHRPKRMIGTHTDITEHKQNLSQLEESEARFRNVVEIAGDAIYLNDVEGRIMLCNRAACTATGYSMEELLKLRIEDFDAEFNEPRNKEAVRALKPGERVTVQARHRRKDGSTFPVEVHISVFKEEAPKLILAVVRDFTEREQIEKAVLRARKAESLVLMAGGIAHDFNNLFQALQGNLELIGVRAKEDPVLTQSLSRAMGVLNRAVSLSWKMLDFSGHSFVQLEPLEPGKWLSAYVAALQTELPASFRLELACEATPWIRADHSKLEQVIKAALDNALEAATADSGRVALRLYVDFNGVGAGSPPLGVWPLDRPSVLATVCLEIADDGPGIPPEKLDLICDPFYTTRMQGRGLGLPAAVGILAAHRAGLHIFNGAGKGLVLRMHFPPGGA